MLALRFSRLANLKEEAILLIYMRYDVARRYRLTLTPWVRTQQPLQEGVYTLEKKYKGSKWGSSDCPLAWLGRSHHLKSRRSPSILTRFSDESLPQIRSALIVTHFQDSRQQPLSCDLSPITWVILHYVGHTKQSAVHNY